MIKILFDQNFNGRISRGLKERIPELDCVATYEVGIGAYLDPQLLAWAANENRVILTHDTKTFPIFAYERIEKGEKMCGVLVVSDQCPIGRAIDEIEIAIHCNSESEWKDVVTRIPL
jgi:hypothetical protein